MIGRIFGKIDRKMWMRLGLLLVIAVIMATPAVRVLADQTIEVPIATVDFTGTTYNDPKTFTVDVSSIKNAKQIILEITLSTQDDKFLRYIYVTIDGVGINERTNGARKFTAIVSPNSQLPLRYDVTGNVKGKDSISVAIYLYNLKAGPYTWTVTAKLIGIITDDITITDPTSGQNIAVPVYIASGGMGLAFLGVAYYFKQRED